MDDLRLTEWGCPRQVINSCYGNVTHARWCDCEIERFGRQGHALKVVTRNDGSGDIAISRQ